MKKMKQMNRPIHPIHLFHPFQLNVNRSERCTMAMSPYDEAMAGQTGRNRQAISPSEEAEALAADEKGVCRCCGQRLPAVPPVPWED
jgi:hypothetical protein